MRTLLLATALTLGCSTVSPEATPDADPGPRLDAEIVADASPPMGGAGGTGGAMPGGAGGGEGGAGGAGGAAPETCDETLGDYPAHLLTRLEWDNTVRDLLGETRGLASARLPPENQVLGFDNNARFHQATPALIEGYVGLAEEVAIDAVFRRLDTLLPCAADADEACGRAWVRDFGRRAFRRALHPDEAAIFDALFDEYAALEGFRGGVLVTLQAMLQSPQFLYRIDTVAEAEVVGAPVPLSGPSLAARLAAFLWASTPDEALLSAAEAGQLSTREGLHAEVRRMLADPKVRASVRHFHRQWLGLHHLNTLQRDVAYPGGSEALRAALGTSIDHFVDAGFEAGVHALLTNDTLHVDADLAALLDLAAPGTPFGAVRAEARAGLLTHPAVLATLAHPDQSSPIHRGIFVRERLLCQALPPPPADQIIEPPDPDPNATTRERFAQHTADEACAGCHRLIDPIGFGFEGYDEVGRVRETENGRPIDATGELAGAPPGTAQGPFDGAVELAARLADSPAVTACIATHWFRYALARGERPEDACTRRRVEAAFLAAGGDFEALMIALATSDVFRLRAGVALTEPEPLEPLAPEPEPEPEPEPDLGRAPRGFLDGITPAGEAWGWSFDPDRPTDTVAVDLYLDGGPDEGLLLGSWRADTARPDVTAAFPEAEGDHGFRVVLPEVARDGREHHLHAFAQDPFDGALHPLSASPRAFRAGLNAHPEPLPNPPPDAHDPQGFVDTVTPDGVVAGWALDRDVAPAGVAVHVYLDGPAQLGGTFVGEVITQVDRPDVVNVIGVPGVHGYQVQLPDTVFDGAPHTVWVYAFNAGHPGNVLLTNAPYAVQLGGQP